MSECVIPLGEGPEGVSTGSHACEAVSLHELGGFHTYMCSQRIFRRAYVLVCIRREELGTAERMCVHTHSMCTSRVRVHGMHPIPRNSAYRVNILVLASCGFRVSLRLSCPWSVVCGSAPLPLRPAWSVSQASLLTSPGAGGQIHLRWRYPEMRSLSLQVMRNCHQGLPTEQNKSPFYPCSSSSTEGLPPVHPTPSHSPGPPAPLAP